ncbi:MAG: MFS transporter [Draconibacterium sp.]
MHVFSGYFAAVLSTGLLEGIGIGVASVISPLYISEISVSRFRGILVSLYQLAITIGFMGAYLVNYAISDYAVQNEIVSNSGGVWGKVMIEEPGAECWEPRPSRRYCFF